MKFHELNMPWNRNPDSEFGPSQNGPPLALCPLTSLAPHEQAFTTLTSEITDYVL